MNMNICMYMYVHIYMLMDVKSIVCLSTDNTKKRARVHTFVFHEKFVEFE